jgi:hypothetical protein
MGSYHRSSRRRRWSAPRSWSIRRWKRAGPRIKLARQALAISSDCAEAYVLLAEAAQDVHEVRSLYEHAVQAGERAVGAEAFVDGAADVGAVVP